MPVVALAQVAAGTDRDRNIEEALALIADAARQGAALICFPEMGFDRFFPQHRADHRFFDLAEPVPGPTVRLLQKAATRHGIAIVGNIFERAAPGEYYDCSPVVDAGGALLGRTRMVHIAEAPLFNEKFYYRPGPGEFAVFSAKPGKLGVAICYDRHYPEQLRILALRGCEMLLVPLAAISREQWPMFEMEMQVASFQNQYFSIVVNRAGTEGEMEFIGRSFVCDPWGQVIARAQDGKPELLLVDVDLGEIERARRVIPHLRDRRAELYGPVTETQSTAARHAEPHSEGVLK